MAKADHKVEIFATNISERLQADEVALRLKRIFPLHDVHFDLEDKDKILRVAGPEGVKETIARVVTQLGFICQELPD